MAQKPMWLLFTILFLASFDMHAQMPLLSPYLQLLGAPAAMIGLVLGTSSVSHILGNVIAAPVLDRYSKKVLITVGLVLAGMMLVGQGYAHEPIAFFCLRLMLGFIMAFVLPACSAILASYGNTMEEQGEIMAKKGMMTTAAAIVSPSIGGFLAGGLGYGPAFIIFGVIMMIASFLALVKLPAEKTAAASEGTIALSQMEKRPSAVRILLENSQLYLAFIGGFAVLFGQGALVYEIPLMVQKQGLTPAVTGYLFSMMGIGSFLVLSQLWLKRVAPETRILCGLTTLGLLFYLIAIGAPVSLYITLSLVGACFGLLFPAMTTMLAQYAPKEIYGAVFSIYSAVLHIGSIVSPLLAGVISNPHHTFFIAFFVVMGSCCFCWLHLGLLRRA